MSYRSFYSVDEASKIWNCDRVKVPDAAGIATKQNFYVLYQDPLRVKLEYLEYETDLQDLEFKDTIPRVEKAPIVWGVVGGTQEG